MNREISTTCASVESRLSQVWHCEPGKMKNVLINRTFCSMVVWRRCSGFLCRTNEGQGLTRVLLQTTPALWDSLACSPALQAHTWLPSRLQQTHWFCILEYSVANKQQDCSKPTLSSADKAQSAKHKLPVLSASLTSSVRQVCSTHFRAALHSSYWGRCFHDLENLNIFAHGTYHPLIYTGEEL